MHLLSVTLTFCLSVAWQEKAALEQKLEALVQVRDAREGAGGWAAPASSAMVSHIAAGASAACCWAAGPGQDLWGD